MNDEERRARINLINIVSSGTGIHSYPVEIAISLGDQSVYHCLIRSPKEWLRLAAREGRQRVSGEIGENAHDISGAELNELGRSVTEVCEEINELMRDRVLLVDHRGLSYFWLKKLFNAAGVTRQFACEPLCSLVGDELSMRWKLASEIIREELGLEDYRALNRVIIQRETLNAILAVDTAPMWREAPNVAA